MKHSPSRRSVSSPLIHWNYFLAIEQDVVTLSRYVELCSNNYQTYSTELGGILMAAAQENDVLLKQIAGNNYDNENAYRGAIPKAHPNFAKHEVEVPRFNLKFTPFAAWAQNTTPLWWTANNKVKHQRHTHFQNATGENTLNAVAGLLIANIYFYSINNQLNELQPIAQLFSPVGMLDFVEFTTTGIAPCYKI